MPAFWIDYSYINNSTLKDYSRVTSGIDYKFQNSLYLSLEYHYNGSSLGTNLVYPETFIFLRDYHYGIFTTSYELTPLLIMSLQDYSNPKDSSIFSLLKFDYNVTENSYIGLGSYLGLGNNKQVSLVNMVKYILPHIGIIFNMKISDILKPYKYFFLANKDDNEEILKFFNSITMDTKSFSLRYDRGSDFFKFSAEQSNDSFTFIMKDEKGNIRGHSFSCTYSTLPKW